ncbi:attacin-A-like [Anticarsia gemmatalis]|uniref:attacin-A-like n=1 Tax=Anticarsia gemmatalis TaxID=129554 RepID=UPI003F75DBA7
MFATKLFLAAVLLVCVSARHIQFEDVPYGEHEEYRYPVYDVDEDFEYQHPGHLASARVRREVQGQATVKLGNDGSVGLSSKIPFASNDKHALSAIGSTGLDGNLNLGSKGIGLAYDHANGHGAAVMHETVPGFGSKLTGAGHATLFQNENHKVGANAFVTKNMPTNYPGVPNFNTVGGGVDYMFKEKIGGSLGMASTPFLDRKDYSAMGNLNVFRSPTSSLDFNAGFKKFDMPRFNSGWEPNFGLSYTRFLPNF